MANNEITAVNFLSDNVIINDIIIQYVLIPLLIIWVF